MILLLIGDSNAKQSFSNGSVNYYHRNCENTSLIKSERYKSETCKTLVQKKIYFKKIIFSIKISKYLNCGLKIEDETNLHRYRGCLIGNWVKSSKCKQ